MTDEKEDAAPIQPLTAWLTQQRKGALDVEAGADLAKLVEAVRLTGKAGTLTLSIGIAPGKAGSLEVADRVRLKLPEEMPEPALWFADRHGRLTRHDPDQLTLPMTTKDDAHDA